MSQPLLMATVRRLEEEIGADSDGVGQDPSVAVAAAERLRTQGFEVSAAND